MLLTFIPPQGDDEDGEGGSDIGGLLANVGPLIMGLSGVRNIILTKNT